MKIHGEPEHAGLDGTLREGGGTARRLVIALLVIILAIIGYLYFFTNVIQNHSALREDAEPLVRKPLPPKADSALQTPPAGQPTSGGGDYAPGAAVRNIPVAAGTVPSKAAVPPQEKSTESAPPPVPSRQAATGTPAAIPSPKKPASAAPASVVTPARQTPPKAVATVAPPVKPSAPGGAFAIQCGPCTTARELAAVRAVMKKAGLTPTLVPGPKQPAIMYRLFVAGFSDAATAAAERDKLREASPDAFVLSRDGNFELYAGSYHEEERARRVQERLTGKEIRADFQQVTIPVATKRLTAGGFSTRDAAAAKIREIQSGGVSCSVIERSR